MDTAHQHAVALVEQGDLPGADPWFANALARQPGDLALIRDFAAAARGAAEAEPAGAEERLEWLVTFLSERVAFVQPDDLPALLSLRDEVRAELDGLARPARPSRPRHDPLEAVSEEGLITAEELRAALEALQLSTSTSPRRSRVEAMVRARLAVDEHLAEVDVLRREARELPPSSGAWLLGATEGRLREAFAAWPWLDPGRRLQVESARTAIEAETRALVQAQRKQQASEAFGRWKDEHGDALFPLQHPPDEALEPAGFYEEQASRLRTLIGTLEALLAEGGPHAVEAREQAEALGAQLRDTLEAQHALYNRWALQHLRQGMTEGTRHLGVLRNAKEALAKDLVEHLGPIDQRLLTPDVARCFSEVFEYLFKHLAAPGSEDDFDREGSKLHALKRLSEEPRRRLEAF